MGSQHHAARPEALPRARSGLKARTIRGGIRISTRANPDTAPVTRRYPTDDGLSLSADLSGDPTQPSVVLLHGGGQTRRSWQNGAGAIARAGHHVIAYDARGHGESDWSPSQSYGTARLVADLRSIIDTLPDGPVLIGASMGGITALNAVGDSEEPIARALILVDVAAWISPTGAARIQAFMRAKPEGFESLDEAADAIAAYNPHRPRSSDAASLMNNLRERNGRFFWHWDPEILGSDRIDPAAMRAAGEAAARRVRIPTLLVRGGSSDLITQEHVDHFLDLLPSAEFREVAGAGHMVAGDRNDAFNAIILDFLNRLDGPQADSQLTTRNA